MPTEAGGAGKPPPDRRAAARGLPPAAGAYALVLRLDRPVTLDIPTLAVTEIGPGRYAYVGSARGPGGIRARVRRHLRRHGKRHWHIDRLTAVATVEAVHTFVGADECDVVAALQASIGCGVPAAGFGSSDCRRCEAHLLALPPWGRLE